MNIKEFWTKFNQPTHSEAAKYLEEVIADLKNQHQASSEEFEQALIKRTGVGVRQSRTYRNSPTPRATIKSNATVLPFIYEMRLKDRTRKFRIAGYWLASAILIASPIIYFAFRPSKPETFGVRTLKLEANSADIVKIGKFGISLPGKVNRLHVGPVKNLPFESTDLSCQDIMGSDLKSCRSVNGERNTQVTLIIQGEVVTKVTIQTNDTDVIETNRRIFEQVTGKELNTSKDLQPSALTIGDERIDTLLTEGGANMKQTLLLSASLL